MALQPEKGSFVFFVVWSPEEGWS